MNGSSQVNNLLIQVPDLLQEAETDTAGAHLSQTKQSTIPTT